MAKNSYNVKKRFFTTIIFTILSLAAGAERGIHTYVVSQYGQGDFKTIGEAIEAAPDYNEQETRIYITKGRYYEKIIIPESKRYITFIGEDVKNTVLYFDDYTTMQTTNGNKLGTSGTATLNIRAEDFRAENITFANTAGPIAQAVAVLVAGNRAIFENCRFLGYQDTLYTFAKDSKQLYRDCYIEGTVDFIFGAATAFFDHCTINCLRNGYITAAATQKDTPYGYVFKDCIITAEPDICGYVFLGRPWRPYAKTVFIDCTLGRFIAPEGWHNWNNTENERTAFYGEYNSRDCNGVGIDYSKRVKWSRKIQPDEYSIGKVLYDACRPEWYR